MSWLLVPLAFLAMFAQDVVGTVMVQSEASGRAHTAAAMDTLQDVCALASLGAVGGSVFAGHDVLLSVCVVAARLAADYSGTYTGVRAGQRLAKWLDGRKAAR